MLAAYVPQGQLRVEGLAPRHLLLLDWLSDRPLFSRDTLSAALSDLPETPATRSLHRRYDALSPDRAGWRLSRLRYRPHQAAQLLLNRARIAMPVVIRPFRRPKVAICLSGQLRGFEKVFETWRRRFLHDVEAEFFVHSWIDIGRAAAQPFRDTLPFEGPTFTEVYREIATALGYERMQALYPSLFAALDAGARATEEQVQAIYGTEHVVLENDRSDAFAGYSNQDKMHYKIYAADRLARDHSDADIFMRLRPDLPVRDVGFRWGDLTAVCRTSDRLFAEKGYGVHFGNLMMGDQCAVASARTMSNYAGTWKSHQALEAEDLAGVPDRLTGHVSLAISSWLNGVRVERLPVRFGPLQDARPLSASECLVAIETDATGTDRDARLIKAARSDCATPS